MLLEVGLAKSLGEYVRGHIVRRAIHKPDVANCRTFPHKEVVDNKVLCPNMKRGVVDDRDTGCVVLVERDRGRLSKTKRPTQSLRNKATSLAASEAAMGSASVADVERSVCYLLRQETTALTMIEA